MPNLEAKIDVEDLADWVSDLEYAIRLLKSRPTLDHDSPKALKIIEKVKNSIEKEHLNAF